MYYFCRDVKSGKPNEHRSKARLYRKKCIRTGNMAQWLRKLAALPEDLDKYDLDVAAPRSG